MVNGELAVPRNPRAAHAGLKPLPRGAARPHGADQGGGLDPTPQRLVNPVRKDAVVNQAVWVVAAVNP